MSGRVVAAALLGLAACGLVLVARPAAPDNGRWLKVLSARTAQPLLLQGALSPVNTVNISAPVDSVLLARYVQFGDMVAVGQRLAQVSDSELKRQWREAEMAAIQARQALTAAQRLESGTEYQGAARRLLAAQNTLTAAQGRGAEAQRLYDKGIIARTELDAAKQEIDAGQSQVDGAHDELSTLKLRRSGTALRVLELDLENRRLHLDDIRAKLKATTMLSPLAGVVLYPAAGDAGDVATQKELNPGAAVTPKDVILAVGDTSAFLIKTWVDEDDARQIAPGQAARVALVADGAREFAGVVRRVSSQARATDGRGQGSRGSAEFEVQILLKPPTDARRALRVGSSVTIGVTVEPGPATLRVPLGAVAWNAAGRPVVRVRRSAADHGRVQEIDAGKSLVDSVEVKSGVAAGEEVWVPVAVPASAAAGAGMLDKLLSGAGND
ncbi:MULTISPECIES: HlyD family secretion protein [unclassified Duganella]|nr:MULTISPECIES: HlyD family efflux transporter periplasmic adaptor subunit [unclassified Duganella]